MKRASRVCGAIDIGSNAIRGGVGQLNPDGELEMLCQDRVALRLGSEAFSGGRLSLTTIDKLVAAIAQLAELFKRFKAKSARIVATSALRETRNRHEVLAHVAAETGLHIELIDGIEEARLVHLAVTSKISLLEKRSVLLDIGGGSVEISLVRDGDILHSESFRMGTVRLLSLAGGEPERQVRLLNRLVRQYSHRISSDLLLEFQQSPVDLFIGTGGNFESVLDVSRRVFKTKTTNEVKREQLEQIFLSLIALTPAQRTARFHLRPDRADVIVPALIVVREVMDLVGIKTLTVPKVGLREGVILDLCRSGYEGKKSERLNRVDTQSFQYAVELGRRFSFGEAHGRQVTYLAERIFDQLLGLHRLQPEARTLLRIGALLHDIGQAIAVTSHHRHSFYIIRALPLLGFTKKQRLIIALIARYHRKSSPSMKHKAFAMLAPVERAMVAKLAGILGLADAMDRSHMAKVRDVVVVPKGQNVILRLVSDGSDELERWALQKKKKLFERTFRKRLKVARSKIGEKESELKS